MYLYESRGCTPARERVRDWRKAPLRALGELLQTAGVMILLCDGDQRQDQKGASSSPPYVHELLTPAGHMRPAEAWRLHANSSGRHRRHADLQLKRLKIENGSVPTPYPSIGPGQGVQHEMGRTFVKTLRRLRSRGCTVGHENSSISGHFEKRAAALKKKSGSPRSSQEQPQFHRPACTKHGE